MSHDPAWHVEYLRLENAHETARMAYRAADKTLHRKRPPVGAREARDAALESFRVAGKARWDFEMAATTIVDIATLPADQFVAALWPNRHG